MRALVARLALMAVLASTCTPMLATIEAQTPQPAATSTTRITPPWPSIAGSSGAHWQGWSRRADPTI